MADAYANFAELKAAHSEAIDYTIVCITGANRVCIIALHAGKIEFQTGELARDIAGSDYDLYLFEGQLPRDNTKLHITSTNFDEPKALAMIARSDVVLAVHGRHDETTVDGVKVMDPDTIFLGGLDEALIARLKVEFDKVGFATLTRSHKFPATDPRNACNRGRSGMGTQIELPKTLREKLSTELNLRTSFVDAGRNAIAAFLGHA